MSNVRSTYENIYKINENQKEHYNNSQKINKPSRKCIESLRAFQLLANYFFSKKNIIEFSPLPPGRNGHLSLTIS